MIKSLLVGVALGAILAAPLAYNIGRGAPALSNPLEDRSVGTIVKETAHNLSEGAKSTFRELTRQ